VGKIVTAWRRGRRIPAGWAVDASGKPVRDGRRAFEARRLTPLGSTAALGSYKGYGLAAAVEILSAMFAGGDDGRVGHFFMAIDPARFRAVGELEADVAALATSLRASEPLDPARPVQVPGDPERATEAERRRRGIPLARSVIEDIRSVARASGVAFELA
jgi:LDH2 family malate/lactate/ureidoglycolate dehydrogenase